MIGLMRKSKTVQFIFEFHKLKDKNSFFALQCVIQIMLMVFLAQPNKWDSIKLFISDQS